MGPHVRFRRVRTREGSPLIKLRNSAARFSRLTNGCGVGFRQLRTCRRTRPGQLCDRSCREQMQQMKWRLFAYSITSSAVASSDCDTVRPSMSAVCALMTSSNLVDCTTGRSAAFSPLRIVLLHRHRPNTRARRSAALARPAARAPQVATSRRSL